MGRTPTVRRVITGVDAAGAAAVLSDDAVTQVRTRTDIPGWAIATIWQDENLPRVPIRSATAGQDREVTDQRELSVGGARVLMWHLPPETAGANPAGMHQTDTIDFVVVLSGEVALSLGDGKQTVLRAGDTLVQGGNLHHWRNLTTQPCVMVVFMVGAHRSS
jgi:quercetin dioxygenase-like cupin family protein